MAKSNAQVDEVVAAIRAYEQAASSRDPAALRPLLALDDPRFREIEDHIPPPFGRDVVADILKWIEQNPGFTYTVRYRDIEAFLLGDNVAYAVAMNDWESDSGTGSGRATFIFVKDEHGDWRIIHGHWSAVPPMEE